MMTDTQPTLLLLDDDSPFRRQMGRALARRGFRVVESASIREAEDAAAKDSFTHALLDMRLEDGNGLDLVPGLRREFPGIRIVMLTGYGNITSAVIAIRQGAVDYLAKPVDPDSVYQALTADEGAMPEPPDSPMSADRVRWEHIQRVYELCDRNVSETARRLNMHRRTLQRILAKRSPR